MEYLLSAQSVRCIISFMLLGINFQMSIYLLCVLTYKAFSNIKTVIIPFKKWKKK